VSEPRDIALGLALLILALLALRWAWRKLAARFAAWRRTRRSQRGERKAEKLLRRHGFEILDRQVACTYRVWVDDKPVAIELRADLLVQNDDGVFVAEVKTGRSAPRIRNAATRRQLLEYAVAYDAIGVLLVDMEIGTFSVVRFPL
jgi:hypothetical protein